MPALIVCGSIFKKGCSNHLRGWDAARPALFAIIDYDLLRLLGVKAECEASVRLMGERKKSIMGKEEFSERLNKLKQSFLDSLPERLSCIDSASEVIALESSSLVELQQALKLLQVTAHDLAGAAGTFGFIELTELACKAELACLDLLASNGMPSCADRQMIDELLVALRERGRAV